MRRRYLLTLLDGAEAEGLKRIAKTRAGLKFQSHDEFGARWLGTEDEDVAIALEPIGVVSLRLSDEERSAFARQLAPFGPFGGIEEDLPLRVIPFERSWIDKRALPWNLTATRVDTSHFRGDGIRLCVLDCGYDKDHTDFDGRLAADPKSFVGNDPGVDTMNHGTACLGIATGRAPHEDLRYGMAPDCSILIGQVLDDRGRGGTTELAAGILWAVEKGAHVISLSVGLETNEPSPVLERVGARALDAGCLLIAAAGNNASVIQPANGPSFMAVAGLDENLCRAPHSSLSGPGFGARIDLGAPSQDIATSFPLPRKYGIATTGTSLAAPHVAGIAALWAEASGARGRALCLHHVPSARTLPVPSSEMGAGLIQAPQPDWNIGGRFPQQPIVASHSRVVVFLAHGSPSQREVCAELRRDGFAVSEVDGVDAIKQGPVSRHLIERLKGLDGVLSVMVEDHAGKFSFT